MAHIKLKIWTGSNDSPLFQYRQKSKLFCLYFKRTLRGNLLIPGQTRKQMHFPFPRLPFHIGPSPTVAWYEKCDKLIIFRYLLLASLPQPRRRQSGKIEVRQAVYRGIISCGRMTNDFQNFCFQVLIVCGIFSLSLWCHYNI